MRYNELKTLKGYAKLTNREMSVLDSFADGLKFREAAREAGISVKGIGTVLLKCRQKVGAQDNQSLIRGYIEWVEG